MADLNTLLPPGTGCVLRSATAINDRGQIVGQAACGGTLHAFLLTPDSGAR
jgi:probable HAF family extracellular repeat protein